MAFGLPKNSPYKVFMDNELRNLFENGQMERIFKKWEIKEPTCKPLLQSGDPLTLKKLISIFLVMCIGLLLSLAGLIYELFKTKPTYNKKKQEAEFLKFQIDQVKSNCIRKHGGT